MCKELNIYFFYDFTFAFIILDMKTFELPLIENMDMQFRVENLLCFIRLLKMTDNNSIIELILLKFVRLYS